MQIPFLALSDFHRAALLGVALCVAAGPASAQPVTAPPGGASENHIDYSAGTSLQDGNRPFYQKRLNLDKDGFGGIDDLYYHTDLGNNTNLVIKGRALAGNKDYLVDLRLTKDDVGYLSAGYRVYRSWFDGSGGYFAPSDLLMTLYDPDLTLDRGDLWFQAGLIMPDRPSVLFRYDYLTRNGRKDSTAWGDTTLTAGLSARGVLPTFLQIKENRHVVRATVAKATEQTAWELTGRYEKNQLDNSRNISRRATESVGRVVTSKEKQDSDFYQVRGSYETRLNDRLLVTSAVAHTKLDAVINGSRIYGAGFDPVFDPLFARRQQRDEGILGLHGSTEMKQSVAMLNAQFVPVKGWTAVAGLRAEKIKWDNIAEYVETNVGSGPAFTPSLEEAESESNKEWKDLTETVEVRYTGWDRATLSFRGEWMQSNGNLVEDLVDPATGVVSIDRDTDFERGLQKYSLTTNWYPRPEVSGGIQYYLKLRQNDYNILRDSTPNVLTSTNRYPAFIIDQDFETNDFNARISWRVSPQVRLVTRYDYQLSKILSQADEQHFHRNGVVESAPPLVCADQRQPGERSVEHARHQPDRCCRRSRAGVGQRLHKHRHQLGLRLGRPDRSLL